MEFLTRHFTYKEYIIEFFRDLPEENKWKIVISDPEFNYIKTFNDFISLDESKGYAKCYIDKINK